MGYYDDELPGPVVAAYLAGDLEGCKREAEREDTVDALLVLAYMHLRLSTFVHKQGVALERMVERLKRRQAEFSGRQESWFRFLTIALETRRTGHLDSDSLRTVCELARSVGAADAQSAITIILMENACTRGARAELEMLVRDIEMFGPTDYLRFRARQIFAFTDSDAGRFDAHASLQKLNLAYWATAKRRDTISEVIDIRESCVAARETDDVTMTENAMHRLASLRVPKLLEPYEAFARRDAAGTLYYHGRSHEALTCLYTGIERIAYPFGRLVLMIELVKQISLDHPKESRERWLRDLIVLASAIEWQSLDRRDRLSLIDLATLLVDFDRKEAQRYRDLAKELRNAPETRAETPVASRIEVHTLSLERLAMGILEAAFGDRLSSIAKLADSTVSWQSTSIVPWRAATAAYHLALATRNKRDAESAVDLLRPWANSPLRIHLEHVFASG